MPMTKDEFLQGIREIASDFNDPNGDFNGLLHELEGEEVQSVAEHDPVLAQRFSAIGDAIRDLRTYVLTRVG